MPCDFSLNARETVEVLIFRCFARSRSVTCFLCVKAKNPRANVWESETRAMGSAYGQSSKPLVKVIIKVDEIPLRAVY